MIHGAALLGGADVSARLRWLERMPVTEALEQMPDAQLIAAVRDGEMSAFGVLFERHLLSAKRAAACLARSPSEREDLVAEAFTRVLRIMRDGRGPNDEFRPYLLVTLRNTAIHTKTRGVPVSLYADLPDMYLTETFEDQVIDRWNATVAADAFASLPERWRMVLWHTEVENATPADVARLLGMRPNSVAALAYRAREGLRRAYLKMHMPEPQRRECRPTVDKLAGWVRHSVPPPLSRKIDRHLDACSDCRERAESLTKVNDELRGALAPVALSVPLTAAYLKTPAVVTAMSGAVSGAASGAAAAVVTNVGAASGLLAAKAAAVQVVAAVAVAATAATTITATSPVPPADAHTDPIVVEGTRFPGPDVGQDSATIGVTAGGPRVTTAPTTVPITVPVRTEQKPTKGKPPATSRAATGVSMEKPNNPPKKSKNKPAKPKKDKPAKGKKKANK